jgi:hypothetical protein
MHMHFPDWRNESEAFDVTETHVKCTCAGLLLLSGIQPTQGSTTSIVLIKTHSALATALYAHKTAMAK